MISFLRNTPSAFAILVALLTAVLAWAYERTLEPDAAKVTRTFYKTLAAGAISAVVLTYIVHRPEPVAPEPFMPEV